MCCSLFAHVSPCTGAIDFPFITPHFGPSGLQLTAPTSDSLRGIDLLSRLSPPGSALSVVSYALLSCRPIVCTLALVSLDPSETISQRRDPKQP